MNIRLLGHRALKSFPILVLAVLAFSGSAGAATNEIEGVWSFEHGAVLIEPGPSGTFQGTVVEEATLAECPHPAGEVMWTGMTQLPDGSFMGFHKWFVKTGEGPCKPDPQNEGLGKTAWRVLTNAAGVKTLKVCFSTPSSGSQPTIAPNGTDAGTTFGCTALTQLAPAPGAPGSVITPPVVVLPPAKGCVAQSSLKIALKEPKYDPLTEVVVKIGSKKVADVKGVKKIKKGITLKKLPASGSYKISLTATTVLKKKLTGSQTYKACTKGSGKITLKGKKKHH